MISCLKVTRREGNRQKFFIETGGLLLEEQVAFCDGRSNPIRHFSAKELLIATTYYDRHHIFQEDVGYQLYEGSLKDLPVFAKKYDNENPCVRSLRDIFHNPYKDIAIRSQMSVHKNVSNVLGRSLETKEPTVVYKFADAKSLSTCISATNDQSLSWKSRLKIAVDLANAIMYLHTAFSRPIILRDIKCSNILLDENNVPKHTDFELRISISEGQSYVKDAIVRRSEFVAPENFSTGYLTEKADVYHFGMLLLELLSGWKPGYLIVEHNILALEEPCLKI